MSTAETIQFIRDKWNEIGKNKPLSQAFVMESRRHISEGGGMLWIKYDSQEVSAHPKWTFVSIGSDLWEQFSRFINTHHELTQDYDPEKHCLLFLSAPRGVGPMYGQMVRVNYERDTIPESNTSNQECDGTWTFHLA